MLHMYCHQLQIVFIKAALDSSVAEHPVTQNRLGHTFLGNRDLITDLGPLNLGRPYNRFDTFFKM